MTLLTSNTLILVLVGAAAVLVLFYGYVLGREGAQDRRLNAGQTGLLWMLRMGAALLTLVALAKPAYQFVETETRLPVLPLLVDESASMGFPDSRESPLLRSAPASQRTRYHGAQAAVQQLQEKLTETHRVRVYTFSDALGLLRELPQREARQPAVARDELFAPHPAPTGDYSNIGDALVEAIRQQSGERVSGVVLLTDGRQTGGLNLRSAAEELVAAKTPVHPVVFGTEFPLRDLRIDDVIASAEASLGDVLTFHVKLNNQISNALSTELKLEEIASPDAPPTLVATRRLDLPRGEQLVSISTIPESEGLRTYRLSVPAEPDEINTANNVAEVSVKIVKRTLRVLLVSGQPSREYFYMVPALLRDPILELSCYLQGADVDYTQQGNAQLERLPQTVKDWERFDVAILFDVDPNGITTQQLAGLEAMVGNGGGLMIIAGRNHGLAKLVQVHAAKIRGLLPVEVDKNLHLDHDLVYDRPFRAARTIQGRNHPVLLASTNQSLNDEVWGTFGQLDFYWNHPVQGPKSKAIVLVEKEGAQGDGTLMAIHRYSDGAVFFSALDDLWRWRYPYESYDYDRLWTRIIRYLGEARLLGTQQQVALASDRRSYSPGETVQISLRVLDPALMAQLAEQPQFVSVSSDSADVYMVPLKAETSGEPVFRGEYRARRLGTMTMQAKQSAPNADSEARPLFDVSHSFQVKMQSLEEADTSADLEAMRTLAEATGGRYFDYHSLTELDTLIAAIPADPQILTETTVQEVWDGIPFLMCFLILVSSELCLRKWWGLL